jgi:hypothetical protein
MDGVQFKIDFEKSYDKVSWSFLQQALSMKGFPPLWCNWVGRFVQGISVGIRVNNDIVIGGASHPVGNPKRKV